MPSLARSVNPEILDSLPPDDPRAMHSRRDIRRINVLMLQSKIMANLLSSRCVKVPRTLFDLGAGDGTFTLEVARRLAPKWRDVKLILLDQQDVVSMETQKEFLGLGWKVEIIAADVFDFLKNRDSAVDAIITNLFLHHFPGPDLAKLLALAAQRTDFFGACEPRRAPFALAASHMVWAIGANDVTRYDAVASVRAGFHDGELSALWPKDRGWELAEWSAIPFTHCFAARHNPND
ncbi:MAG: class I SAM-dependent methyltransferase [Methylocystis sp.]